MAEFDGWVCVTKLTVSGVDCVSIGLHVLHVLLADSEPGHFCGGVACPGNEANTFDTDLHTAYMSAQAFMGPTTAEPRIAAHVHNTLD